MMKVLRKIIMNITLKIKIKKKKNENDSTLYNNANINNISLNKNNVTYINKQMMLLRLLIILIR